MSNLFEQHHLTAARDGDTFTLRQIDHSGNEDAIALDISQLRHLAELAGIAKVGAGDTAARRFRTVADKLFALANAEYYRSEIFERCGHGADFLTELGAVCDLADEFLRDMGNADAMPTPGSLDDLDEMDSLAVEVADDGLVLIYQTRVSGMGGCDEHIELHPIQAAWLAKKLARGSNGNSPSNEKSDDAGIPVTQASESKRGRPATGEAMTNAERQARYRAKQAELLPAAEPAA